MYRDRVSYIQQVMTKKERNWSEVICTWIILDNSMFYVYIVEMHVRFIHKLS